MAKIIQILDVNSDGHRVRLSDGRAVTIPHGHGDSITVGDEYTIPPSLEFLNGPAQGSQIIEAIDNKTGEELIAIVPSEETIPPSFEFLNGPSGHVKVTYQDGTIATGESPLPSTSPNGAPILKVEPA